MSRIIAMVGTSGSGKTALALGAELVYNPLENIHIPMTDEVDFVIKAAEQIKTEMNLKPSERPVVKKLVSYTTRAPRAGEINGIHYNFVTKEEFDKLNKYEESYYSGNYYGIAEESLALVDADFTIAIVEQVGARTILDRLPDSLSVFVKISQEQMKERMLVRGDSIENIEKRIINANNNGEFHFDLAQYTVNNSKTFYEALKELVTFIESIR